MIAKKSENASLERRKGSFLQLGFILSLSIVLVAFEWSNGFFPDKEVASILADELPPEIITVADFLSPNVTAPKPKQVSSKLIEEVEISETDPVVSETDPEKFEEVDPSLFEEEGKDPQPVIEPVTITKEIKTVDGNFLFLDGCLPHYQRCSNTKGKEMFDCVNEEISIYLQSIIKVPPSIYYSGNKLVVTTFTVDENGEVSEVFIHKEKQYEKDVVKEVRRAISALPKMIPGKQGDAFIRARFTLPINLKIQ